MSKKDYVKNAKVGDVLNQAALNDFKNQSNSSKSILKQFDGINYKIETIGTISNMKYSKNFEEVMLEFVKEQKEFNKEIKSRLDVLESFHKNDFDKLKSQKEK